MVPKAVVHQQVARRELVEVSVRINVGPMPIHAIYAERPDNPLPAAVAAMAAEIAREQGMATQLWSAP
jgi:hypothetical protein